MTTVPSPTTRPERPTVTETQPTSETPEVSCRAGESATAFAVRAIQFEAWQRGYASGLSNAMRRMSDEPNAPTSPNPYANTEASR